MEGGLIKSSFITNDEMKACKLTSTKFPQKNHLALLQPAMQNSL